MQGRNFDYGHQKSDSKEGQMARRALLTMAKDLYNLYMTLNDHDDLPEWCHYKLATSRKDLSDITDYLTSKVMKMCVDKKMSTEDLRLEIYNSMSNDVLEEGFKDFIGNIKDKFANKKKLKANVYDILDYDTFISKFGNSKIDARIGLLRSSIIKVIIDIGNLYEFIIKNKFNPEFDLEEDMFRKVAILDYFGLKDKYGTGENRQAISNIVKAVNRKLPSFSSPDIKSISDKSNLKYDIDFEELNRNLEFLNLDNKHDQKSIEGLLKTLDENKYENLILNFYTQLKINLKTLEKSYFYLKQAYISLKGFMKEDRNFESLNSPYAKELIKKVSSIVENDKFLIKNEVDKLDSALLKISDYLNINHAHLVNSARNNIKLGMNVNLKLYHFYKDIQNTVEKELLRLNIDISQYKEQYN